MISEKSKKILRKFLPPSVKSQSGVNSVRRMRAGRGFVSSVKVLGTDDGDGGELSVSGVSYPRREVSIGVDG